MPNTDNFQWSACLNFVETRQHSIVCYKYIVGKSDYFNIVL